MGGEEEITFVPRERENPVVRPLEYVFASLQQSGLIWRPLINPFKNDRFCWRRKIRHPFHRRLHPAEKLSQTYLANILHRRKVLPRRKEEIGQCNHLYRSQGYSFHFGIVASRRGVIRLSHSRNLTHIFIGTLLITVLIGYYDYHPVTKSPKIGCYDCFSNVPNILFVL